MNMKETSDTSSSSCTNSSSSSKSSRISSSSEECHRKLNKKNLLKKKKVKKEEKKNVKLKKRRSLKKAKQKKTHKKNEKHKDKKKTKKQRKNSDKIDSSTDKKEANRLILDLLQKGGGKSMRDELEEVFVLLEKGETILLHGIENDNIRKKMRHLFKALKLKQVEVDSSNSVCSSSKAAVPPAVSRGYLMDKEQINRNFLKEILKKAYEKYTEKNDGINTKNSICGASNDKKMSDNNIEKDKKAKLDTLREADEKKRKCVFPCLLTKEENEIDDDEFFVIQHAEPKKKVRESWMNEPPKQLEAAFGIDKQSSRSAHNNLDGIQIRRLEDEQKITKKLLEEYNEQFRAKSLLQMHQAGEFRDKEKETKEFILKRKNVDLWGLSSIDQRIELEKQQSSKPNEGDPWRRFDKERDFSTKKQVTSQDFEKLVSHTKEMNMRFGAPHYHTSFM